MRISVFATFAALGEDAYLIKTDAQGHQEWTKTFGGPASDVGHSVTTTQDGDFVVVGYTTSFAEKEDDPYLIKVDPGGNTLWTRVIPLEGINHTLTGARALDGGFCLGGGSVSRSRGSSGLLVKVDRQGGLEWTKGFFATISGQSMGYTTRATSDGGCVLTGHTTEGSAGGLDLFIAKVGQP